MRLERPQVTAYSKVEHSTKLKGGIALQPGEGAERAGNSPISANLRSSKIMKSSSSLNLTSSCAKSRVKSSMMSQ